MNIFAFLFLLFSMAVWSDPSYKIKRAHLGQEFTFKVGEQVVISEAGLKISFASVEEDSRCPKGVDCIWAGNGKIIVNVKKGGAKAIGTQLNTNVGAKQARLYAYDIKLVGLNPYPQKDVKIKPDDYGATLIVTDWRQ